jgi:cytochrome c biogenesis protein CcmG/thiol:disulfide interchange protein DsbE
MSRRVGGRARHTQPARNDARFYVSAALAFLLVLAGLSVLWFVNRESSSDQVAAGRFATPVPQVAAAADFALQTLDGHTVRLSDYRGYVVVLNTWATWCPPCRAEMPDLEAYYREHQGDGFVVLAVNSQESADTVAAFLEEHDFTFPVLLDPDGIVLSRYGIRGLPTSFFIDRDGMVHGVWSGQLSPARLKELVDPLL